MVAERAEEEEAGKHVERKIGEVGMNDAMKFAAHWWGAKIRSECGL